MLQLQHVTLVHPDGDPLFSDLDLHIPAHAKVALIGDNGAGKSTLLRLMAGSARPTSGTVRCNARPYYIPQLASDHDARTVAEALGIAEKLSAFHAILAGELSEANLAALDEDWTIEERCRVALDQWGLAAIPLDGAMQNLSGGQRTKVFLAGIAVHAPEVLLLDEPSNHLDTAGRLALYVFVRSYKGTLVVVSHDRRLLELQDMVLELDAGRITTYGGNFTCYMEQRAIAQAAQGQAMNNAEKALRTAERTARETAARQQKLDARGQRKQEKAGMPTIMMKTMRNAAERSTARTTKVHSERRGSLEEELRSLRADRPDLSRMKLDLGTSALHRGKTLIEARHVNVVYAGLPLWRNGLSFTITSGERIAVQGPNGSGKTTAMKLMLGQLSPTTGMLYRADARAAYIDQDYSLIDPALTVYEQAQRHNSGALAEHEVCIRLDRFLFPRAEWDKPCSALSGGERMRLMLCGLTIQEHAPDMLFLDEPTNNLDLRSMEILTTAIREFQGTLVVVSHDTVFVEEVGVDREIMMD